MDSEETINNEDVVIETIELLDSDSENMLKDLVDLPVKGKFCLISHKLTVNHQLIFSIRH